jgi:Mg2+-importing ATPase
MIFLAAVIDYIQELKAYKTNHELTKLIENNFLVLRESISNLNSISFLSVKDNLINCDQSKLYMGTSLFYIKAILFQRMLDYYGLVI